MRFGCYCIECCCTYETTIWRPPWVCPTCVEFELRYKSLSRWAAVGAEIRGVA